MQPDLKVKLGGATETRREEAKVVPICIYFFPCLSISFHMLAFAKLYAIGLSWAYEARESRRILISYRSGQKTFWLDQFQSGVDPGC